MKKILIIIAIVLVISAPEVSFAHEDDERLLSIGILNGPIVSCVGGQTPGNESLDEPLEICTSFCDVFHTIQHVIYFAVALILYVLGPVMALAGGIMIMISGPSPSLLEKGKKTLTGAITGIALALVAYIIIGTFLWLITGSNELDNSWPNVECTPQEIPEPPINDDDNSNSLKVCAPGKCCPANKVCNTTNVIGVNIYSCCDPEDKSVPCGEIVGC